jgi:serine/threonine protein phosphatase PrpC
MQNDNSKLSPRRQNLDAKSILRDRFQFSANKDPNPVRQFKKVHAHSFALDNANSRNEPQVKETSIAEIRNESITKKIHSSLQNNKLISIPLHQLKDSGSGATMTRPQNRLQTPSANKKLSRNDSRQTNIMEVKPNGIPLSHERNGSSTARKRKKPIDESTISISKDCIETPPEAFNKSNKTDPKTAESGVSFYTCPTRPKQTGGSKLNILIANKVKKAAITLYNDHPVSLSNIGSKVVPKKLGTQGKSFVDVTTKINSDPRKLGQALKGLEIQSRHPGLNLYDKMHLPQNPHKPPPKLFQKPGKTPEEIELGSFLPANQQRANVEGKVKNASSKGNDGYLDLSRPKKSKPSPFAIPPPSKYYSNNDGETRYAKESEKTTVKNNGHERMMSPHSSSLDRFSLHPNIEPGKTQHSRSVRRNRSLSNKLTDDYLTEKALKNRNVLHGIRTRRGYNAMNLQKKNQDAYFAFPNFMNSELLHLFGVCDGHGTNGEKIAEFVAKTFPHHLEAILLQKAEQKGNFENIASFLLSQSLEMSIFQALEKTVEDLTKQEVDSYFSGTTLNAILIVHNNVFVCNVGDSRSVMASGKNFSNIIELSEDHKPENENERKRILSKNGRIEQMKDEDGMPYGPLRVWLMNENLPGLAMTRSIGDMFGASIGITWRPSMVIKKLEPSESAILFVASDGVWEVVENYEIMLEAKMFWADKNIEGACDNIMSEVLKSWKQKNYDMIDDITFILVFYG